MNLVEKSVLDDDAFVPYSAKKVSVSDTENVYNGQKVIIYTRIWNDNNKRYEYYAVDHDGSLIRCYDTGDNIEWIGSKINTALWEFTEYKNSDGTVNYYYELQNTTYGQYLAPQAAAGQILFDDPVGIHLNGRRYGRTYTPVTAWDDSSYSFSGLKTENGKVVPCALAEAEDFYFAVVNPIDEEDELTEVDTVDHTAYGITMKMVDFDNPILDPSGKITDAAHNGRDSGQTAVFGLNTNTDGLLQTTLGADGYPETNSGKTGKEQKSLSEIFGGAEPVNQLFIQSIYNESGYFEYDSTQNFATLKKEDGEIGNTFTVYDQLGAISDYTGDGNHGTGRHGQFMPYDEITAGKYCDFENRTSVLAQELADQDPRKGEKLYNLGTRTDVDYFFGMEMEAGFTQTASGLDAWGHDIIFEFSGDDDFWLYVDDELVLDLGGVHTAMTGSINFRTGEVISGRGIPIYGKQGTQTRYTLREIFETNYRNRNPEATDEDVAAYLDGYFEDGGTVFKDYSPHRMKMFYMERGAGASNLHMRFNLAAAKPGTVVLSKKLSGTESEANSLIEFPYQIWYMPKDGTDKYQLLTEKTEGNYNVTYKDSINPVTYKESFTVGEETYEHVFFLKPGESAVIDLPDDIEDYYIVECGVNTAAYDTVTVNGELLSGTNTNNPGRQDFRTSSATMEDRPNVDYDNHVSEGAMRTLSTKKILYDVDGQNRLSSDQDDTLFRFRLYLGNEFTDEANIPLAGSYPYLVKNPNGYYCRWDKTSQSFVPLQYSTYEVLSTYLDTLSDAEKETIVFRTSINGTISKIPANYTVEVRDLPIGTHWKMEEREDEIPKGYTLRLEDGYTRTDGGEERKYGTSPVSDTMKEGEDPFVEVRNQKGWGLTVEKVWTDEDFMDEHDTIFFAVYVKDQSTGSLTLLEDSVREMKTDERSLYYFFGNLQSGIPFENYVVFEVTADKETDAEGHVTYTNVYMIEEGGTLTIGGKPAGGECQTGYEYKVHYDRGEQTTQNENVRTDTVMNSRPGIRLYKTKWNYEDPLGGAVFTLKDAQGADAAAESYTSRDTDGLITIAYLKPGTYTLSEIRTPQRYVALNNSLSVTVNDDGSINVTGDGSDNNLFRFTQAAGEAMASITIRNRPVGLEIQKIDGQTKHPLEGVHFALYKQVTDKDGNKVKDYLPISGYEDLVTDENGVLQGISMEAPGYGTYYLTETQPAEGYDPLSGDLCFTVGRDGKVILESGKGELSHEDDQETGKVTWIITIPNEKEKKVSFKKVDIANTGHVLAGAVFDLYKGTGESREEPPLISGLESGGDGMLAIDGETVFSLPAGDYELVETKAPAGYNTKEKPVVIHVTANGVTYDEGTLLSAEGTGVTPTADGVFILTITNSAGVVLPASGGLGTAFFTLTGTLLLLGAGILFVFRRRHFPERFRKGTEQN